ncbi:hypothetical protein OIE66_07475 [Nonomuraea sp. NBC_01738]|uniref:hypothetical protein n=1 Tax=Nonomuraea sp. NBC_01738 TaxID=2976003 RepID=UPI002E113505|nr:hypothetical protein OIE66_07475 [Nonomuraea sp. NBC_01738]
MWGRLGKAGAIYAALGVLWWASVELAAGAITCEDWPCVYPLLGTQLGITAAVLVGAWWALRLVKVAAPGRLAVLAAVLFSMLFAGGWLLPMWPRQTPDSVMALTQFGGAALLAGFCTERAIGLGYRAVVLVCSVALVPACLVLVILTGSP